MVNCPFCNEPMKKRAINIEFEVDNENTVTLKYDNCYTCKRHGDIIHPDQRHRVDLP
jgi:hypothetical protein